MNGDAGRLLADDGARGADGLHYQVPLTERRRIGADAGHLDRQAGWLQPRLDRVVQGQREAERVEARAEVRAGRRDADGDRAGRPGHASPSAAAAAAASTPMVTGSAAPATAVSGSFSPWPVMVHTTTVPA